MDSNLFDNMSAINSKKEEKSEKSEKSSNQKLKLGSAS